MEKILVFTKPTNFQDGCHFSLFGLQSQTPKPILVNHTGRVEDWRDADLIIISDENIFFGEDWIESRNLLKNMITDDSIALHIVYHKSSNIFKSPSPDEPEIVDISQILSRYPSIEQSHVPDSFFCVELKAIIESIRQGKERYCNAIDDAISKFPDPILETKLNLLHALFLPLENFNYDDLSEWKALTALLPEAQLRQYDSEWHKLMPTHDPKGMLYYFDKIRRCEKPESDDYNVRLSAFRDFLLGDQ